MQTLREIRDKMKNLHELAKAKLEEITDDTTEDRCHEINNEFDAIMAEIDTLEARAARMQSIEDVGARLEQRSDPRAPNNDGEARGANHREDERENTEDDNTLSYEYVFEQALRFGVSALNTEQRGVLMESRFGISNGELSRLPEEIRAQATGTASAGGHLVPQGFSGEIDRALAMWGPMWNADIVRELVTATGNNLPWPTIDDTTKEGREKAENDPVDDDGSDDAVFGQAVLGAHVFDTGMVRIPYELLQDSAFDMESMLDDLFGERLGRKANRELTVGVGGASNASGIVTGSSLGTTAASAVALAADEIIDLLHSVDPAYRESPKCRWQFNDTTLRDIRKLKDGQGNYLWQMGDVRAGEPNRLLEHPYSINQAMPTAATGTKPIIFGDHNRYVVRKVRDFSVLTLRERYAERFQVGMVGFKRFDGLLLNSAAVKHMLMA